MRQWILQVVLWHVPAFWLVRLRLLLGSDNNLLQGQFDLYFTNGLGQRDKHLPICSQHGGDKLPRWSNLEK
jgi:hypothetical protein